MMFCFSIENCRFGLKISDVPREAPGRPSGISARALASENRRAAKAARLARAEQMNTPQNVAGASRAAARARANGRALIFLYCFLFFGETHRERAERAAGGSASEPSRATRTWRSGNPSRAAARARASSFAPGHRSWLARHITAQNLKLRPDTLHEERRDGVSKLREGREEGNLSRAPGWSPLGPPTHALKRWEK